MGERTPLALIDAPGLRPHGGGRGAHQPRRRAASAPIGDVKLSANWMAAAGSPGEDAGLFDTVQRGRNGTVPGAGHRHPGRQGLAVDEDGVAGRRAEDVVMRARCR